ncbi:hypothetical protein pEaSNUABM11_00216 [Erwinia phage pEa_SNUABM_11]|nr:hypothetical protein pEaSNUABM11_00216 [Erwinia phage pEa_SNUABM_11]
MQTTSLDVPIRGEMMMDEAIPAGMSVRITYTVEQNPKQPRECSERMRGNGRRQLKTTRSGFTYPEVRRRG